MKLTRATPKAIKYACLRFHYARAVPSVQYGYNVYNENNEWCGVICYGGGANSHLGNEFGFVQGECLELVRVALNGKQGKTSECVAASLKKLHSEAPHIKAVISYADKDQNHAGTIYQATNWLYFGLMNENTVGAFIINGKKTHPKTVHSLGVRQNISSIRKTLDPNAKEFITKGKHKYVYVFKKSIRKKFEKQSLPYPKKMV